MAKQFKPETLCVQAGWTPKTVSYTHLFPLFHPETLSLYRTFN